MSRLLPPGLFLPSAESKQDSGCSWGTLYRGRNRKLPRWGKGRGCKALMSRIVPNSSTRGAYKLRWCLLRNGSQGQRPVGTELALSLCRRCDMGTGRGGSWPGVCVPFCFTAAGSVAWSNTPRLQERANLKAGAGSSFIDTAGTSARR